MNRNPFRRAATSNVDRAFDEALKTAAKVVGIDLTAEERQSLRVELATLILKRVHARLLHASRAKEQGR